MCIGQRLGCEASIHALNEIYDEEATEAILLVDASNAFNRLNRKAALSNAMNICPAIETILVNKYRQTHAYSSRVRPLRQKRVQLRETLWRCTPSSHYLSSNN